MAKHLHPPSSLSLHRQAVPGATQREEGEEKGKESDLVSRVGGGGGESLGPFRTKIRLIEGNAKCRHLKEFT
jgi:hypothetical protein